MAAVPPICDFGWRAPDFRLPATDGKTYGLDDIKGPKGTLIVFICNHCPYVMSIADRLAAEAAELQAAGIGVAAICANDAASYPEDSFDNMKRFAARHHFSFPYLHDESQAVARAWDAVCTPDFFGFNADLELQYRGRLDATKTTLVRDARRDLHDAMMHIARSGKGPQEQIASMGCSIKWKAA
jgi:peroxiredoxin